MTDKPNSPIRRVSVSKAPPPINPIRVGRYTAPNVPPVPPPNWNKWGHMRDVELWEAVALSLNLEPDKLPVYLAAFERFGDDPFRICPQSFLDRLQVANSNCGISLGYRPVHKLKARCLVDLPAFGAWAVNQNIPDMPPKLAALAATESQAAPIVPINELTGLPFCEALEQSAYQRTPEYQTECTRANKVWEEIEETENQLAVWERVSAGSVSELDKKEQKTTALKARIVALKASIDHHQPTTPTVVAVGASGGVETDKTGLVVKAQAQGNSTKAPRKDSIDPVIELAQTKCRDHKDTNQVWPQMQVLADNEQAPFLASTAKGLKYHKNGKDAYFTRDALDKRLHPEKRKAPAARR